jgi:hypothetical protein
MYGSRVWWPRVRHNVSRMEVSMLQILLACLTITWVMKTTRTAAVEALLRLYRLHVMNDAQTQDGIYTLKGSQQWRPKSTKFGTPKNLMIWNTNPSYRWGPTGCF